jgi:hypothetical protein
MQGKTHTSQKDPPEGSREVIEGELKRKQHDTDREPQAAGRPAHEEPDRKGAR